LCKDSNVHILIWRFSKKLNYKKTNNFSHFLWFFSHDIDIGQVFYNWGRKDTSKYVIRLIKQWRRRIISSLWSFRSEKLSSKFCKSSLDWISREGRNALKFRFLKSSHIASVVSNLFLKNLAQNFGHNQEIVHIITFLHYDSRKFRKNTYWISALDNFNRCLANWLYLPYLLQILFYIPCAIRSLFQLIPFVRHRWPGASRW